MGKSPTSPDVLMVGENAIGPKAVGVNGFAFVLALTVIDCFTSSSRFAPLIPDGRAIGIPAALFHYR